MTYCSLSMGNCPYRDCEKNIDYAPSGCAVTVQDMSGECDRYQQYRKRVDNMTLSQAIAIFGNLDTYVGPDEEKGQAIWMVLNMETHNSITKASMLKAIRWLLELSFDIQEE